jgi:hypothetical protein
MKQPLKINKLLGAGVLAGLLARSRELGKMDILLAALLPAPLNSHCRVLSIRNSILDSIYPEKAAQSMYVFARRKQPWLRLPENRAFDPALKVLQHCNRLPGLYRTHS